MDSKLRSAGFWRFQFVFWGIAGTALFVSGATQMPVMQAFVRNLFLLIAGFLSSFFLARLIDELRFMKLLRLRLTSYALAYTLALFCVVAINAITFTLRGVALADLSPGQWFSGTFNLALVYAFWSELFIQRIDAAAAPVPTEPAPDRLVLEHRGRLVPVAVASIDSIVAAGDYVEICTAERRYLHRQTLHAIEEMLRDERFVRVHRSTIVNGERVESVAPLRRGRYRLHLAGGSHVTSSRSYRDSVESRFLGSGS